MTRAQCEDAEARAVDAERALPLAIERLRAALPEATSLRCTDPRPLCEAGPADGVGCRFRIVAYPRVVRVTVWSEALDGALFEGTALLSPALDAEVSGPQLDSRRWAVAGPLRMVGAEIVRMYGPGSPEIAPLHQLRFTAYNRSARDIPIRALGASAVGRYGHRGDFARHTLSITRLPPGESEVTVTIGPAFEVRGRSGYHFEVRLRSSHGPLAPRGQITIWEIHDDPLE